MGLQKSLGISSSNQLAKFEISWTPRSPPCRGSHHRDATATWAQKPWPRSNLNVCNAFLGTLDHTFGPYPGGILDYEENPFTWRLGIGYVQKVCSKVLRKSHGLSSYWSACSSTSIYWYTMYIEPRASWGWFFCPPKKSHFRSTEMLLLATGMHQELLCGFLKQTNERMLMLLAVMSPRTG